MTFIADFGMDVEAAAHHPRIDVSSADSASADRAAAGGGAATRWRRTGRLEVVEHNAVPINFACPNVIVQSADGTRTGISDAALAVVGGGGAGIGTLQKLMRIASLRPSYGALLIRCRVA